MEGLRRAGLRPDLPAFFSWLGVVPYLEPADIRATLQTVAGLVGSAGGITFDYRPSHHPNVGNYYLRLILWLRGRRVARLGEPFRSPLAPADAERWLRDAGFVRVTILGPRQLTDRYLRGRRLRMSPLSYLAVAWGSSRQLGEVGAGSSRGRSCTIPNAKEH